MASGFSLPPPTPLEIHDQNAAEKWKKFNLAWNSYSLATELNKKSEKVQVATLLTVIGEEAHDVYPPPGRGSTFTDWAEEGDQDKIVPVLQKFAEYCQPRKNVPFERYRFNRRTQEVGESYDQYKTALCKLAEGCDFDTITDTKMTSEIARFSAYAIRKCTSKEVKATDLEDDDEAGEMYQIEVAAVKLDDSQLVTLKLESGSKIKVIGRVSIRVWRNDRSYLLDCRLVDNEDICPILGIKSCLAMNIIQYKDNDLLNKPETGSSLVYAVEDQPSAVTKEELMLQFPDVFSEGLGQLDGEYKIRLDENVPPVQHAPRRVTVALRPQLKETLDALEAQGVIAQVTTPTKWISSMVTVPKKNGKLQICLDPKDLNRAIKRENYQLPTVEDIATRLHGAKVFMVMDVRNGFWHVSLDEESSYLTTFQTPFGRYRWKRMPFGISSAPEVFQRKMHELIEGLAGVEVVVDDFIAVGYGNTFEEATQDHDKTLVEFLKRCEAKNVRLNPEKLKLRQSQVLFIGHMATDQGLEVDPAKV
ncbi:hypothetical protein ACROYT_G043857 [Oculina patagonica]